MPRSPITVRRAGPSDLDDVMEVWGQAREEGARSGRPVVHPHHLGALRGRLRDLLNERDVHVLLAVHDGLPAGYAIVRTGPLVPVLDERALHVEHLYVVPSARRRGVATSMLAAVTALAERGGVEQVFCNVPAAVRDTQRFFARLGFSPLLVRRVTTTAALRRRLSGSGRRSGLDAVLVRRRSARARRHELADLPDPHTPADTDVVPPAHAPAPGAPAAPAGAVTLLDLDGVDGLDEHTTPEPA